MQGLELISKYGPFLEEIRKKIFVLMIIFLTIFISSFFLAGNAIKLFLRLFDLKNAQIVTTSPFQFFGLAIDAALFMTVVTLFPFFIFFSYSFLKPALTKKERKFFRKFFFASMFLFCLGFCYGFIVMNIAVKFMAIFNNELGVTNMWDIRSFISQVLLTSACLGILFQFPLLITILVKFGLLSIKSLKSKRRLAFALSIIIPALLPPTDALSLILMALPMMLMFEITVFLNIKSGANLVEAPLLKPINF